MSGVESGMDPGLKSRKAILVRHSHVQMRVKCALAVVGHQDFHLADRQILDVLVLGARVLDVGFTSETNWFVFLFKDPGTPDA